MATWADLSRLQPAGGRLLVATPMLNDPNFVRTVVYLLEHDGSAADDAGGTLGVILNRPSVTPVGHVLPSWHDAVSDPAVVFTGGPVQADGALCLGQVPPPPPGAPRAGVFGSGVRPVVDGVATIDLDGDVAVITGLTRRLRVFAGHSGWSPGQLAAEIKDGGWFVVPGRSDDLFGEDPKPLWSRVLRRQPYPLSLVSTYPRDTALD